MENLTYQPSSDYVAACGLYCGACRKFVKNNAPDARQMQKLHGAKYGLAILSITIRVVRTVRSVPLRNVRCSTTS